MKNYKSLEDYNRKNYKRYVEVDPKTGKITKKLWVRL